MQAHNQSSRKAAAAEFRIAAACTVSKWERLYREGGIVALQDKPRGRPIKSGKNETSDKEPENPRAVFQSAEEELEYLRAENTYLLQALIREKQKTKLNGLSPVQYRTQAMSAAS